MSDLQGVPQQLGKHRNDAVAATPAMDQAEHPLYRACLSSMSVLTYSKRASTYKYMHPCEPITGVH